MNLIMLYMKDPIMWGVALFLSFIMIIFFLKKDKNNSDTNECEPSSKSDREIDPNHERDMEIEIEESRFDERLNEYFER